jgi:hypothetical protein
MLASSVHVKFSSQELSIETSMPAGVKKIKDDEDAGMIKIYISIAARVDLRICRLR